MSAKVCSSHPLRLVHMISWKKSAKSQGRKRNPNPNFRVRISSGGVGVFHVKVWGPKSSVCPSKPGKPNFFGGISPGFCQDIPEALEKFEKKVCVQLSFPKSIVVVLLWLVHCEDSWYRCDLCLPLPEEGHQHYVFCSCRGCIGAREKSI